MTYRSASQNRIIVIGMTTHTFHILQPLDLSVFSSYKPHVTKEFKMLRRTKKVVDLFGLANMLHVSYQTWHSIKHVRSGFHKGGNWNYAEWAPSVTSLTSGVQQHGNSDRKSLGPSELLTKFEKKSRALLRAPTLEVSDSETVRLNISRVVHYTSTEALKAITDKEEATKVRQ